MSPFTSSMLSQFFSAEALRYKYVNACLPLFTTRARCIECGEARRCDVEEGVNGGESYGREREAGGR